MSTFPPSSSSPPFVHPPHRNHLYSLTPNLAASRSSHTRHDNPTSTPTTTTSSNTTTTARRRPNSHLTSSLFPSPAFNMAMALSNLPPDYPGEGCKAGEAFTHEWPIYNLNSLKEHVEDRPRSPWSVEREMDEVEVLPEPMRRGIVIGGGWFKLDLARTIPHPHSPRSSLEDIATTVAASESLIDTLSLYIAALSLDASTVDISYPTTIFVGIKSAYTPTGSRYAETKYHWQTLANWDFTPTQEFWEVRLPKLSDLLAIPELTAQDALCICVQISTPQASRPTFTLPGQAIIPQSLINGLGGLVDSTTGDVKFMCLQHTVRSPDAVVQGEEDKHSQPLSRKRVLYAHSDILKEACGYFHDLLTGEFEEAERARRGDSRHVTILIDDAEFETVYWLLKFIYTNELVFAPSEDVRVIMDQLRIDPHEINRVLAVPHFYGQNEWDYRYLYRQGEEPDELENIDARTTKSFSSVSTRLSAKSPPPPVRSGQTNTSPRPTSSAGPLASKIPTTSTSSPKIPRPSQSNSSVTPSRNRIRQSGELPPKIDKSPLAPAVSPQGTNRSPYAPRVPDPHSHPCPPPGPASALSVFILSHRYRLKTLEGLAKDHILEQLTKENCMPMLLATHRYDSLHAEILDYIIDHWGSVQVTDEFRKSIQEVSAGVWGETGGLVLHGLFCRL